jgi:hypothetical protein
MVVPMPDATAEELAQEWRKSTEGDPATGWSRLDDAASSWPEIAWSAILCAVGHDLTPQQRSILAAGPLEVLLSEHGPSFIDRLEAEAARSDHFREILSLVWRLEMTDDVWARVQKAREQQQTI